MSEIVEIDKVTLQKYNPQEIANVIFPRIESAIEVAKTPEELNTLRNQITVVTEYLKATLPQTLQDRNQQFPHTHKSNMLYLKACAKAGAVWDKLENKSPSHRPNNSGNSPTYSVIDVGFKDSRDATTCTRIAEIDEEDWRVYEEETLKDMRQPTLNALENIWRMLQPKPDIDPARGVFSVIYADPPWRYNFSETVSRKIENQYPTLTVEEIISEIKTKIQIENDAVLFLWATAPKLREALEVMEKLGFEYKTNSVWDKGIIGMGYWFRGQHEHLLVGTKGNFVSPPAESIRESSVYREKRTRHSTKPEHYRELIEKMYPELEKIDVFARKKRKGWTTWGT